MAKLTITARNLGPLSVEVIATGENSVGGLDSMSLSSRKDQATTPDLPPGDYAVVATRPNGETLIKRVRLDFDEYVDLVALAQSPDPQEFLDEATRRGLVPSSSLEGRPSQSRGSTLSTVANTPMLGASGTAGRNLNRSSARMAPSTCWATSLSGGRDLAILYSGPCRRESGVQRRP